MRITDQVYHDMMRIAREHSIDVRAADAHWTMLDALIVTCEALRYLPVNTFATSHDDVQYMGVTFRTAAVPRSTINYFSRTRGLLARRRGWNEDGLEIVHDYFAAQRT